MTIVRPEKASGSNRMRSSDRDKSRKSRSVGVEASSNRRSLSTPTFDPEVGAQTAGRNASDPRCSLVMLKLDGTSRWYYGEVSSSGEAAASATRAHPGVTGVACRKDSDVNRGGPRRTRSTGRWCLLATASYKGFRSGSGFSRKSEGLIRASISVQQNAEGAKEPYFGVLVKWERRVGLP